MTEEELRALPVTIDIETAARALGIGRSTAYKLADHDELGVPVLRIGRKFRIVTADLRRVLKVELEQDGDQEAA